MNMSNNLYFVCLNEEFGKEVCEELAKILVLPFIDCEAFIADDLLVRHVNKENANLHYLKMQEEFALCSCLQQNGVFLLNYDILKHNFSLFKDKDIYYLRVQKELVTRKIDQLAFSSRDKFLLRHSLALEVKSTSEQELQRIIKSLGDKK